MRVLGIESSCHETGVDIYGDDRMLAHPLYSQLALHAVAGGVVPYQASRRPVRTVAALDA